MKATLKNIIAMVRAVKKAEEEVEEQEKVIEKQSFHANAWDFLIQLIKTKEFWLTIGALFGGGWFMTSRSGNDEGKRHRDEIRRHFDQRDTTQHFNNFKRR